MNTPKPKPGNGSRHGVEREPGYEPRDVDSGGIGLVSATLVLGLIFTSITCALYYQTISVRTQRREGPLSVPVPERQTAFPRPELQARPSDDLAKLRRAEDTVLTSYGWIDPKAGVVRIPIERAMELTAQRGLPAGTAQAGQKAPTWQEMLQLRAQQGSAGVNAERRRP